MADSPFACSFGNLPRSLSLFPLDGVLLLPGAELPLNVFEPRYLGMVLDTLGASRMIGVLQPETAQSDPVADQVPLRRVGCAGRVTAFQETQDGRLLITLSGICRFRLGEDHTTPGGYRLGHADYDPYQGDMARSDGGGIDRAAVLGALRGFGEARAMRIDWDSVDGIADEILVNQLAMGLPFAPDDKQALLEARDLSERGALLTALLDMAARQTDGMPPSAGTRH